MLLLRAKCQYRSPVAVSHFFFTAQMLSVVRVWGLTPCGAPWLSSSPWSILTSQLPSLLKLLFAPGCTKMGPSVAAWMKMSDWKPHRPQGRLSHRQAHCRKTASFREGQNPPVLSVWPSPLSPAVLGRWQPTNRNKQDTPGGRSHFFH